MSLESRNGWNELYLTLGAWPERIMEAVRLGKRDRDELDFYLCFFVQSHSMRDWLIKSELMEKDQIDGFINSYDCMRLCRDISNRYKHLTIRAPSVDADWEIWIDHDRSDQAFTVTASGNSWLLWDLMMECIGFWEACTAAFNLSAKSRTFRPS
jgi:hypothetical protein